MAMAPAEPTITVSALVAANRKLENAGAEAAWLWLCSLATAKLNRTDGFISRKQLQGLSDHRRPERLAAVLVANRLWHEAGHGCLKCPQPLPGGYVIHDYPEWQGTEAGAQEAEADARDTAEAKAEGGTYGNHRRWHASRDRLDPECRYCIASASDNRSHMRSETDRITDPSTESDANRIAIAEATDAMFDVPPPPPDPPLPRVDITPPTPPARKRRGKSYDYDADLDFLRFWETYPIKRGKPDAFKEWTAALARGADAEVIILAAKRYADDPQRNPIKSKHPQGWLSAERYNDDESAGGTGRGRNFDF